MIYRLLAGLSIQSIIIGLVVLFYEGVFFLNWWPVNQIPYAGWFIQGEISRRIDDATLRVETKYLEKERKALLKQLARDGEAEDVLGEREAIRAEKLRQQAAQDAQRQVSLVKGQSDTRAAFLRAERLKNEALQKQIDNLKSKEPEVVIKYVDKIIKERTRCTYAGDLPPTAGFMREYRSITKQAN